MSTISDKKKMIAETISQRKKIVSVIAGIKKNMEPARDEIKQLQVEKKKLDDRITEFLKENGQTALKYKNETYKIFGNKVYLKGKKKESMVKLEEWVNSTGVDEDKKQELLKIVQGIPSTTIKLTVKRDKDEEYQVL